MVDIKNNLNPKGEGREKKKAHPPSLHSTQIVVDKVATGFVFLGQKSSIYKVESINKVSPGTASDPLHCPGQVTFPP